MIKSRQDLRYYLSEDLKRYNGKTLGLRDWFLQNESWYIWQYTKLVRKFEYYTNNKNRNIWYKIIWLYYLIKHKRKSIKNLMYIFPNTVGEGLMIYHLGNIMISKQAQIGKRFTVRPGCVIGNVEGAKRSAIIEDDVEFSLGVKVFGAVKIGRGALINGNALIIKNIPPYAVVTGNPAKVIGFRFTPEEMLASNFDVLRKPKKN